VDRLVVVTAIVPEPGRSIVDVAGPEVRQIILSVSRDDGDGCRSFDLSSSRRLRQRRSGPVPRLPPGDAACAGVSGDT
jgi:hypothetical protein